MSSNGVKAAATALIRMMRAGKLSAPSISRAAQGMDPGKFRFVRNLGRGQFNLADEVVGNVGGHAGPMVRKLPAHAYTRPQDAYRGVQNFVDQANQKLPTPSGVPAVAPYKAVNNRGAFQQLGNQSIHTPESLTAATNEAARSWGVPRGWIDPKAIAKSHVPGAERLMGDLHQGNVGPGGQILDFSAPGVGWAPQTAHRVASGETLKLLNIPGGYDTLANATNLTPQQLRQNQQINNSIRRFYDALAPEQRQTAEALPSFVSQPTAGNNLTTTPFPGVAPHQRDTLDRIIARDWDRVIDAPAAPVSAWSVGPRPVPRQRIWPWLAAGGAAAGGGGLLGEYLRSQGKR